MLRFRVCVWHLRMDGVVRSSCLRDSWDVQLVSPSPCQRMRRAPILPQTYSEGRESAGSDGLITIPFLTLILLRICLILPQVMLITISDIKQLHGEWTVEGSASEGAVEAKWLFAYSRAKQNFATRITLRIRYFPSPPLPPHTLTTTITTPPHPFSTPKYEFLQLIQNRFLGQGFILPGIVQFHKATSFPNLLINYAWG